MPSSGPSLHALVCDLVGGDPDALPSERRPTVTRARRRCAPGELIACRRRDRPLVLAVLADGRRVTVPDRCPHDGGPLSDGFLDGDRLVCARHGWEFDLNTGACTGRPAVTLRVRVESDHS